MTIINNLQSLFSFKKINNNNNNLYINNCNSNNSNNNNIFSKNSISGADTWILDDVNAFTGTVGIIAGGPGSSRTK